MRALWLPFILLCPAEVMAQLDAIMESTSRNGTLIKKTLDEIKKENATLVEEHLAEGDSAKAQMRNNLYQTHIRRFHTVINEHNTAVLAFKKDLQGKTNRKQQRQTVWLCRSCSSSDSAPAAPCALCIAPVCVYVCVARTRRELKMVDASLSDAQVEHIIESGQAQDVVRQALISDDLKTVVHDIEERHLAIIKLEQQVGEPRRHRAGVMRAASLPWMHAAASHRRLCVC
jgi:t-SNARE complex subunit (syntaxin)